MTVADLHAQKASKHVPAVAAKTRMTHVQYYGLLVSTVTQQYSTSGIVISTNTNSPCVVSTAAVTASIRIATTSETRRSITTDHNPSQLKIYIHS